MAGRGLTAEHIDAPNWRVRAARASARQAAFLAANASGRYYTGSTLMVDAGIYFARWL